MTTEVILTQQYIQQHIKDNNIDTTKPFKLDLSYNKLTSIEKGTFDGLDKFFKLDLSYNKLTSIEKGAFNGLDKLIILNLSNNKISSIEKGAFNGLDKLTKLNLYDNKLTSIENKRYESQEEILELIEKLNSLDSEVDNVDCLVDGNTTLNDIKDKIDKYREQIIQEIINFLSK